MPAKPAFRPYIPASARLPELTPRALLLGMVLGLIFGASSLYLVLKVGLTVSASIPVAVIAVTLFRLTHRAGGRDATVLENNIAQTAGSAGESIAFGLGVTMPAILILGFDLELTRVMLVAVLGSLLGILLMIPLRRSLIVAGHGQLQYPEGTACAEVLKAAASGESRAAAGVAGTAGDGEARQRAALIFGGFAVGLAYKVANIALKGWKDVAGWSFGPPLKSASVALEVSPELLGVGYIIGPRIAATMFAGGVLAYLLLIPMISFFGAALPLPLAPGAKPIAAMSPGEIRGAYVLYIGAGAVAAGGVIGMLRALPTIWHSLRAGVAGWGAAGDGENAQARRTERDLAMKWVLAGIVLILAAISIAGPLHMNILGAVLILVFGFLFVTVSSRLTGEIGSSSNPISGMTVATLLLTCLIFLLVGWTGGAYYVTALSVGAIVCIAASTAGATSQDLKTAFLPGATTPGTRPTISAARPANTWWMAPAGQSGWWTRASTVATPPARTAARCASTTPPRPSSCPTSSRASWTANCPGAWCSSGWSWPWCWSWRACLPCPSPWASTCPSRPRRPSSSAAWCAAWRSAAPPRRRGRTRTSAAAATAAPACSWPPATSPAARWPASSSRSARACWAVSTRPSETGPRPTTRSTPAPTRTPSPCCPSDRKSTRLNSSHHSTSY